MHSHKLLQYCIKAPDLFYKGQKLPKSTLCHSKPETIVTVISTFSVTEVGNVIVNECTRSEKSDALPCRITKIWTVGVFLFRWVFCLLVCFYRKKKLNGVFQSVKQKQPCKDIFYHKSKLIQKNLTIYVQILKN